MNFPADVLEKYPFLKGFVPGATTSTQEDAERLIAEAKKLRETRSMARSWVYELKNRPMDRKDPIGLLQCQNLASVCLQGAKTKEHLAKQIKAYLKYTQAAQAFRTVKEYV